MRFNSFHAALAPFRSRARLIAILACMTLSLPAASATYTVSTVDQLTSRLASAASGDVIVIRAGTYQGTRTVSGVKTLDGVLTLAPVFFVRNVSNLTIRGESATNKPVLKARGIANGEYVFYAQNANNLKVQNLKIQNGEKGLVFDRSNNVVIQGVDFSEIGWEALHVRDGSRSAYISGNSFQAIGVERSDRGEGVYIGSDKDKWHPAFHESGDSYYQPQCDNAVIENNRFGPNIGGESVDVKEGTTGTTIRNNVFNLRLSDSRLTGNANEKSNSAIDVKGHKTIVMDNDFDVAGNVYITTAIDVFAVIKSSSVPNTGYRTWGFDGFFTRNGLINDSANQYVASLVGYGGAKIGCNLSDAGAPHFVGRKAEPTTSVVSGSACNTPPSL